MSLLTQRGPLLGAGGPLVGLGDGGAPSPDTLIELTAPTVVLVPQAISEVAAAVYLLAVQSLLPDAYLRLGESSGGTATDASGNGNNGTYTGSPTLGATGLLTGDADTAVTFNGTSQYVSLPVSGGLAARRVGGISIGFRIKTSMTGAAAVFGSRETSSLNGLTIRINVAADGSTSSGRIRVGMTDSSVITKQLVGATPNVNINDGNEHSVVVSVFPATSSMMIMVDGVFRDITYNNTDTITAFDPMTLPFFVGALNSAGSAGEFLAGTLDEVWIGPAISYAQAQHLHALATGTGATLSFGPTASVTASGMRVAFGVTSLCSVGVRYSTASDLSGATTTSAVSVDASTDFTGHVDVAGLAANTTYYYTLVIDGVAVHTSAFPTAKTYPASGGLSFAFSSCTGHTTATVSFGATDSSIFDQVPGASAFFAHIGDLFYGDGERPIPSTLPAFRSIERYISEGRDSYSSGWAALRKARPVYTTWDDHDFAVNNFSGGTSDPIYVPAVTSFNETFGGANPAPINPGHAGSHYYSYDAGGSSVFVTDSRSYRVSELTTDNASKPMLGTAQLDALKAWLLDKKYTARFKFIISSTPAHGYATTAGDSWGGADDGTQAPNGANGYRTERNALWDWIDANRIPGVVILSGDNHWGGAFKTTYGGRARYEFMGSHLNQSNIAATARAADLTNGPVYFKYEGRNFFYMTTDLSVANPTLTGQLYTTTGSLGSSYAKTLSLSDINSGLSGDLALAGPTTGAVGVASAAFAVQANLGFNGSQTVTVTVTGGTVTATATGGSVTGNGTTSAVVTPAAGATDFTFTFTPSAAGAQSITLTNGQSWTNPSAATYTATSDAVTAAVAATGSVTYTGTAAVVASIVSDSAVTAAVAASGSITYTGTAAVVASVIDTPAGTEPVTVAEAKQAARISGTSDFDEIIPGLITAARQLAEQETGRELVRKTKRSTFTDWPAADLVLPVYGAASVAISYWGDSGWTALDAGAFAFYELGTGTGIAPAIGSSWPALSPVAGGPRVRVDVTAGPADPATAEACVKLYIKALVAWWVDNPVAVSAGSLQPAPFLRNLLDPVRLWG